METKEKLKEFRKENSVLIEELKSFTTDSVRKDKVKTNVPSREVSQAITKAELSKAWLGKLLGTLIKEETPYKNDGKRKSKKDIEPEKDAVHKPTTSFLLADNAYVKVVDKARENLKMLIEDVEAFKYTYSKSVKDFTQKDRKALICINNVYSNLVEARFMLGWELGRVRDNE